MKWRNGRYYENINSLEESGLLMKSVSEKIQKEAKEQKGGFLSILLGISFLGKLLTGKGTIRAGEGTIRAGEKFWFCPIL